MKEAVCIDSLSEDKHLYLLKELNIQEEKQLKIEEIKNCVNNTESNIHNLTDTSSLIKNNIIILNESVQQLVSTVKEDKSIDISTYILSNELCVSTFKMQEMLSELEKSYELLNDTFLSIKFLSNQIK